MNKLFITLLALAFALVSVSYVYYSQTTAETKKTAETSATSDDNNTASFALSEQKAELSHIPKTPQVANIPAVKVQETMQPSSSNNDQDALNDAIPADIKQKLCQKSSNDSACAINLDSRYATAMLTENGEILAAEVTVILDSNNFNEVLTDLASKKIEEESFHQEANYNDKLAELTAKVDVSSNGVSCDDNACGLIISGKDEMALNEFQKKFLAGSSTGNYFVSIHINENEHVFENRILFFPGNTNPVISRLR